MLVHGQSASFFSSSSHSRPSSACASSRLTPVAAITLQVYMFFLCYSGDEEKGVGYALGRLSIREETAILWKGVCNTAYLLLFWAVQTVLAVLFAHWYAAGLDPAVCRRAAARRRTSDTSSSARTASIRSGEADT